MTTPLFGSLQFPPGYPLGSQQVLHDQVHAAFRVRGTDTRIQSEIRSAMNSVAYRFKSCQEAADALKVSLRTVGDAPPQPARWEQEMHFFHFVIGGMAAIEALFYAMFGIGAIARPTVFPMSNERERTGVTPRKVLGSYHSSGPKNVADALKHLCDSQEYKDWHHWRRILFHRGMPGRIISVGSTTGTRYNDFGDLGGPALEPNLALDRCGWLADEINRVWRAAQTLV